MLYYLIRNYYETIFDDVVVLNSTSNSCAISQNCVSSSLSIYIRICIFRPNHLTIEAVMPYDKSFQINIPNGENTFKLGNIFS